MRPTERVVIYSALTVAMLLALGARPPERSALARQPGAASAGMRLATVDILDVSEALLSSDRYKPIRDQKSELLNTRIKSLADELEALRQRIVSLPQGDPVAQTLYGEYQTKNQAFQKAQQDAYQEAELLNVRQLAEAYRLATDAVTSIARDRGFSHVLVTKSGDAALKTDNVPAALQEILSRPLLLTPGADDLTEATLSQLGVTRAPEAPATPEAPAGVPPAPAGTPSPLRD